MRSPRFGIDRPTAVLRLLLVVAIAESFVHYADNTLRYDEYTVASPSFPGGLVKQWVIPLSWVLFTLAGIIGYRRFRQGRRPEAAAWIGAYSTSGLISILHYRDISIGDLSAFQNTFVFLDIALGMLLLAFALWTALAGPTPTAAPEPPEQPARSMTGGNGYRRREAYR
jgi:hypothetical protein